jgi:hypothetical protein
MHVICQSGGSQNESFLGRDHKRQRVGRTLMFGLFVFFNDSKVLRNLMGHSLILGFSICT